MGVVDDKALGDEVVVGLDGEVEGLLLAGVLDGGDAVPEDVVAAPLHRHLAAGPEVVELAVALRRQEGVVAGGDDGAAAVAGDAVGGLDAVAIEGGDARRAQLHVGAQAITLVTGGASRVPPPRQL